MAVSMLKKIFETTDFTKLKHDKQIHACLSNEQALDMGTTMVIILITNNKAYLVNIGDSRIYQYSEQGLKQLTVDHNILNLYLQKNTTKESSVDLNHTYWKALTSALGPRKPLKTDIFHLPLIIPSYFLLTSDGVHDFLEEYEIVNILEKNGNINNKVKLLIKQALLNVSTDNVTALLMEIKF